MVRGIIMERKWSQWKAFKFAVPGTGLGMVLCLVLFTACPDKNPSPVIIDCPRGQRPCEGDSAACCPVECPEGFHLGGVDSTDCIRDTTSHSFIFELDTFGVYPSALYDVAIVNENDIWAVGDIKTGAFDTTFYNGDTFLTPIHYNAVHWDGVEWELVRIQPKHYLFGQYTSVFGFESNDVWFGSSIVVHWDGNSFTGYGSNEGYPGGFYAKAIWGTSSSDMYFVGGNGSIVHYDGSSFTKLESGTETPLRDIWGLDENHIWVTGYETDWPPKESVTLFFDGMEWTKVKQTPPGETGTYGQMLYVWAFEDSLYITTSEGLWKESLLTGEGTMVSRNTLGAGEWTIHRIRGNGYNDIFILSSGGKILHYNGSTWRSVFDYQAYFPGEYFFGQYGLEVRGDEIVVVGSTSDKALIVRGQR